MARVEKKRLQVDAEKDPPRLENQRRNRIKPHSNSRLGHCSIRTNQSRLRRLDTPSNAIEKGSQRSLTYVGHFCKSGVVGLIELASETSEPVAESSQSSRPFRSSTCCRSRAPNRCRLNGWHGRRLSVRCSHWQIPLRSPFSFENSYSNSSSLLRLPNTRSVGLAAQLDAPIENIFSSFRSYLRSAVGRTQE